MAAQSLIGMIRDGLLGQSQLDVGEGVEAMPVERKQPIPPSMDLSSGQSMDAYGQQSMAQEMSQPAIQDNINKPPQDLTLDDFVLDENKVIQFGVKPQELNEGLQAFKGVTHGVAMLNDINEKKSQGLNTGKEESFFDQVASGVKKMFGNEEKMLGLALAFNTMRMTPDQGLASHLSDRLKTIRANKSIGQSADSVMKALAADGSPVAKKYAQMVMNNPKMVKEIYAAYIKEVGKTTDNFETGSGSYLSSKFNIPGLNPDAVYKYNSTTGEVSQVTAADKPSALQEKLEMLKTPGGEALLNKIAAMNKNATNVNIDLGKANEDQFKRMNQAYEDLRNEGIASRDSINSITRYVDEMEALRRAGGSTGQSALTKKAIYEAAQKAGIPIGEDELARYKTLDALAAGIVLTELRKNKGPQTDFDAQFQAKTLPGLGKSPEASLAIATHLRSADTLKNMFSQASLIDRPAVLLSEADLQKAATLLKELNLLRAQLPSSFIDKKGNFMHFESFYKANARAGNYVDSPMDLLKAWKKFTSEEAR